MKHQRLTEFVQPVIRGHRRSKDHDPLDYYPTPPIAVEKLLLVETFPGLVWEPACGDGAISRILEANQIETISTDLIDRGYGEGNHDFFKSPLRADHIITNPPYKLAQAFVEHALTLTSGKVAMLVRVSFLGSAKRKPFFLSNPPARVYLFAKRITLWKRGEEPVKPTGGGIVDYVWCVWDHSAPNMPTQLHWL
ncbi:hypothetical protein [Microvirga mediterraneensis]|uniref:SAM-dependent methyltransferase n=1 Tax=Microvirga mediterraneensis TaxID=2754695 RepID=A0A838BP22_9HYPH|nr:hypothetical protein [Microvirga mediterraneensis]MBA1157474.1 hypothetical protein [Microvirga mediterraneensis]